MSLNIDIFLSFLRKCQYLLPLSNIYSITIMNVCTDCNLTFKSNKCLQSHYRTKKHIERENRKHKCVCGKSYIHRQALHTHKQSCIVFNRVSSFSPTQAVILETENKKQKKEIQTMKSQIDQLTQQVALLLERGPPNTNTTHNTNNTTNNNDNSTNTTNNIETQNVIIVNSFGNENTEYLTDRIMSKLIKDGPFTCLPKIIERIHFDPEHPENHNIKVTNPKNNYAKVIKDRKWVLTNKKRAIDAMIQNSYDILEEKYQDNKESIPSFKQERFESFQEKYTNDDKELMRNIKGDVDIAVLNGTENIYKNNGEPNGEP